jgi:type IV secretory pathway TraG/TraD family ATPase VirD4
LLASAGSPLAVGLLVGLGNTEARERSSIFSAAADAIDAYASRAALDAASDPNFDAGSFVRSRDTIYIHAPAERQHLAAPLVCGLLSEIRRATYDADRTGELPGRVLFALDEVANIAPLSELPRSRPRAAAKAWRCSPRSRTSARHARGGGRSPMGS